MRRRLPLYAVAVLTTILAVIVIIVTLETQPTTASLYLYPHVTPQPFSPPSQVTVKMYALRENGSIRDLSETCDKTHNHNSFGCTAFCTDPPPPPDPSRDICVRNFGNRFPYPYTTPGPNGTPVAVNPVTVSIESDYLLDVVPQEMNIPHHPVAIQAQAIAARTYTYWHISKEYTMNNSTSYQAFIPYKFESLSPPTFPDNPNDPCASGNLNPNQQIICNAVAPRRYLSYFYGNDSPKNILPIYSEYTNDVYMRTEDGEDDRSGAPTPYLKSVADPVSSHTDIRDYCREKPENCGHGHGMSQHGASRWVYGNLGFRGNLAPWSVRWDHAEQILTHYYTGIYIRDADNNNQPLTPDYRWNPLQIDWGTEDNQPPVTEVGSSYPVTITVQNTGVHSWTLDGQSWALSYHWAKDGQEIDGTNPDWITETVPIGDPPYTHTLTIDDVPNWGSGSYTLKFDMLRSADGDTSWFSDDGWPTYDVGIRVEALPAPSVDVMLVIDRSDSMSGQKLRDAKNAAKQFVDFMVDGDKIGVASFSSSAAVNYGLATVSGSVRQDVKDAIDSISSSGYTSIGSGLQQGTDELINKGDPAHPRAIVLLSNGQENRAPWVADILPSVEEADIVVYTIALGASANEELMQEIANQTGGTYHFAPSSLELADLYNIISAAVAGQQTLFSDTRMAQQGRTDTTQVIVDSALEAIFSIIWGGSDLDLTLEAPSGTVIDPAAATADPNIGFTSSATLEFYRIKSPEVGQWTMQVEGVAVPSAGEPYTARVRARSNLTMEIDFDKDQYVTGEPILVTVSLSDGQPITGAIVSTTIKSPSSETSVLPLYDDGGHRDGNADDGIYANTFTDTTQRGSYRVRGLASGVSNLNEPFSRQTDEAVFVGEAPSFAADLWITKSGPAEAQAGSLITYTIEYGNNGPDDATNVVVGDNLPPETTYMTDTIGGGDEIAGFEVGWALGSLPAGAQESFFVTVAVTSTITRALRAVNLAEIGSQAAHLSDPVQTNNSAEIATQVRPQVCSIAGRVSLQGRNHHNGATILIDNAPVTTTVSNGGFGIGGLTPAIYKVTAAYPRYLASEDNAVKCLDGETTRLPATTLLGGDTNIDGRIDILDAVIIGVAYNTCAGDPNFDIRADINESGCVDIFDVTLVGTNYDRTAPTSWPTVMSSGLATTQTRASIDYAPDLDQQSLRKMFNTEFWNLQVDDVSGMYGIDVTITFDSTLVRVVDTDPERAGVQILPGSLFTNRQYFMIENQVVVDEKAGIGTIRFAATLLNPTEPVEESGELVVAPFKLLESANLGGSILFSIEKVLLAGEEGRKVSIQWDGDTIQQLR